MKVRDVKPTYPPEARASGIQGVVILETLIDADGFVVDARVLRSIPLLERGGAGRGASVALCADATERRSADVLMTVTVNFMLE